VNDSETPQSSNEPTAPVPTAPVPQAEQTASYPAYSFAPPAPATPGRARISRWVWPFVTALALLVGLVGGLAGGAAWQEWHDDSSSTLGTLSGVDTETKAPLPADNGSISAVAQKLLPSTVQVLADYEGAEQGATGSGFVLDRQGHVVTNNHVVADADTTHGKVIVVNSQGKRFPAEIVGRSSAYDLAVLHVDGLDDVTPAALGTSTDLKVGEGVVAIGSPLGLSSTVTSGIVSALNRPVSTSGEAENETSFINAIQTDAAINPGNSGGPLVDLTGRVIGVNSAIATVAGSTSGEGGNIGVGFAIPIEQVRVTADQILRDGKALYPVIGASVSSDGSGDGAHVSDVQVGSPAASAGLTKGDVVNALDGKPVTDNASLIVAIRSHLPGDEVTLTVLRDGKERSVKLKLDSKVG
jgi:putative serine protease PepD